MLLNLNLTLQMFAISNFAGNLGSHTAITLGVYMKIKGPGCLWVPSNPIGSFLRQLWMSRYNQKDPVDPDSLAAVWKMFPFHPDLATMTLNDLTGQFFLLRGVFECFWCTRVLPSLQERVQGPRSYFISLAVTSSYPIRGTRGLPVRSW